MELIAPGIWKFRAGTPEPVTPFVIPRDKPLTDALSALPAVSVCPISEADIQSLIRPRGTRIEIAVADNSHVEQFYGLGLQLSRVNQTGRKKTLRVNSDPIGDAGDSHAPVPFYVSTAGYGVYVDTARYASFYLGGSKKLASTRSKPAEKSRSIVTSTEELYAAGKMTDRTVAIDVPTTQGVDIYIFAGPTMMNAVQRYNLFSGGGCLPPMWGLGVWYRMDARATQQQAMEMAKSLRAAKLPCDVLGLEPGWQTHAYSCSFVWNRELYANPDAMVVDLRQLGFEVNLWEHVFVHPTSPIYEPLKNRAGDYEVWGGLVPDLFDDTARQTFSDYHRTTFVDKGITGFKLDECDGSDYIPHSSWSFPETSQFPTGLDGEQTHSLLGLLYQRAIYDAFESTNTRTYSLVRSSGAFAAPCPFVLYSDLYDHRDFIRGVLTSGFCGLLWTPEVRHAISAEDLIRRIQAVVLSPQALINAWYIKNPPWLQFDRDKNNAGDLLPEAPTLEAAVRELFRLRMSLVPYLYAAFAKYALDGTPPFRAVQLDFPDDQAAYKIEDQYLMGDDLLIAPIFDGQKERTVYLPTGDWYHFQTYARYAGGKTHTLSVDLKSILIFVRSGTILPLAEPVEHVSPATVFDITPLAFGPAKSLRPTVLFEDDGVTFNYRSGAFNRITLRPDGSTERVGTFRPHRYNVRPLKQLD